MFISMAVHTKFVLTNVSVAVLLLQLFTTNRHSTIKIVVLQVMTPCSRVIGHQGFGEKCAPSIFRVEVPSSLKTEAENS